MRECAHVYVSYSICVSVTSYFQILQIYDNHTTSGKDYKVSIHHLSSLPETIPLFFLLGLSYLPLSNMNSQEHMSHRGMGHGGMDMPSHGPMCNMNVNTPFELPILHISTAHR